MDNSLESVKLTLEGGFMNRHSYTYEQYCNVVGKNVIIQEQTFLSGKKKIRCLHFHKFKCDEAGGCQNKYVKRRIDKAAERFENERKPDQKESIEKAIEKSTDE
jgi:hypothetical protein